MVSHLFYYQLALLALVWLFLMLHVTESRRGAPIPPTATPIKPKSKRSNEPKPFNGLTKKPHCALCARETAPPPAPPPTRPAPMPPTNRRPREVDTSMHFCPHSDCDYRGWLALGNLRANGHPGGGPRRQFYCTSCQGYFLETHGTIFHGKQAAVELIVRVLACLAEGLGIRATARVFEVDANTVLQWLVEAAEHLRAFSRYFLCEVHVEQVQLDELYAVLRDLKAGEISEEEAMARLERSPYWVWTAMDPKSKLLVVVEVGTRTLAMAQRVVHQLGQVLAPGCVPLFLTDGLKDYATALLTHFGYWMQPQRRQDKGPMPKPRWIPLPSCAMRKSSSPTGVDASWGHTPCGVRHPTGHRAAPGGLWLDHQHVFCRAPQPRPPSAGGGDRAPGEHPVPGRSRLAGSVIAISGLSQLRVAPRQSAPAPADSRSPQR